MTDLFAVGTGDRVILDRDSPLRERMIGVRGNALVLLGILVAPLVMAGYVGLAVLFLLPFLALRWIFPCRSTPAVVHWDAPRHSGIAP